MGGLRSLLVGLLTATAGFVAVGLPAPAPAAEGPRVLMVDNEPDLTRWHFEPAQITVPAGTTVVWFNKGKQDHSVTADDKSFDSGLKKTGATFSRAFARPGKYAYHCAPHPWMTGTVEVAAAVPTARTAAAADPTAAPASVTTAPAPPQVAATAPASSPATAATTGTTAATPGPQETAATATPASAGGSSDTSEESAEKVAAPASHRDGSGDPLAGTLALVLLPTLGALALGAKLRHSRS